MTTVAGVSDHANALQSRRLTATKTGGPSSTGQISAADSGIGSIDRLLPLDDGFGGMESPMSTDGGDIVNGANSLDGLDNEGDKSLLLKSLPIDVFSDRAVKIEAGDLDRIFDSDEEEEEEEEEDGGGRNEEDEFISFTNTAGGGGGAKKSKQKTELGSSKTIKVHMYATGVFVS